MFAILIGLIAVALTACTSALELAGGHYAVPKAAELRSPLGTNIIYPKLEHCSEKSGWWVFSSYTKCRDMTAEENTTGG